MLKYSTEITSKHFNIDSPIRIHGWKKRGKKNKIKEIKKKHNLLPQIPKLQSG